MTAPRSGCGVDYVTEDEPLGTGGGIRNVADRAARARRTTRSSSSTATSCPGTTSPPSSRAHHGQRRRRDAAPDEVEDPRAFGCVPTDDSGRVTAFLEKTPDAGHEPDQRRLLRLPALGHRRDPGGPAGVGRARDVPGAAAPPARWCSATSTRRYWLDLGTPAAFVRGSCDLVLGRARSPALPGPAGESLVLAGATVDADAPCCRGGTVGRRAGDRSGRRARRGQRAARRRRGRRRRRRCATRSSAVVRVVGAGVVLDGVVVGDGAEVGDGNELAHGARVWVDAHLPAYAIRFTPDEPSA